MKLGLIQKLLHVHVAYPFAHAKRALRPSYLAARTCALNGGMQRVSIKKKVNK